MDGLFTEYLWWKALALIVIVGVWGFVRGLNGQTLGEAPPDRKPD